VYLLLKYAKRSRILLSVFGLTGVLIAITASAKLWAKDSTDIGPVTVESSAKLTNPQRPLILLPIQLRPTGFLPSEVNKPAGNFEFLLINASGRHDITMQLEREHGEKVQTFNLQRGRNLRKQLHLGPGIYNLSVVEYPEWVCRLTITNP